MKPNTLKISAFGPYTENVVIDFTRLNSSNLFLISGDTGSGKTTIFDAISYALFGVVSGDTRSKEFLRNNFCASNISTFVEFSFTFKGLLYKINRSPQYKRQNKRGDGLVTQKPTAVLEKPDGSIIESTSEVTNEIETLLGINHSQFKQICMIAQGEFQQFLFSTSTEKTEIFRKIFNTDNIDYLQKILKERTSKIIGDFNGIKNTLDTEINRITIQIGDKNDTNGIYSYINEIECNGVNSENINRLLNVLETYISQIETQVEIGTQNAKINRESFSKRNQEKNRIDRNNENIKNFKEHTKSLENLLEDEFDIKEKENIVTLYENSEPLLLLRDNIENLRNEESKTSKRLVNLNEESETLSYKLERVNIEVSKKDELQNEIKRLNESTINLKNIKEDIEKYSTNLKEIKGLEAKENEIQYNINNMENSKKYSDLHNNINIILSQKEKLYIGLDETYESFSNNNTVKEKTDNDLNKENEVLVKLQNEYKTLNDGYMDNIAGFLAKNLQKDYPCSVCGSAHHPKRAVIKDGVQDYNAVKCKGKELENKRKKVENLNLTLSNLKTSNEQNLKSMKSMTKNIIDFNLTNTNTLNGIFTENHLTIIADNHLDFDIKTINSFLYNEKNNIKILRENLQDIGKFITMDYSNINTSIDEKDSLREKLASLKATNTTLRDNIERVFAENIPTIDEVTSSITQNNNKVNNIEKTIVFNDNNFTECNTTLIKIERDIKNEGYNIEKIQKDIGIKKDCFQKKQKELNIDNYKFKSITDYTEKAIEDHRQKIKIFNDRVMTYRANIDEYKSQITNENIINTEKITNEIETLEINFTEIIENKNSLKILNGNNKDIKSSIPKLIKEYNKQNELFNIFDCLSKTCNGGLIGSSENMKLTFESYIQSVYFEQILQKSNVRLKILSEGRYTLKRAMVEDKRVSGGLDINVNDNWNAKERSVKTLSGGEAFNASLALALGFSDVIQEFSGGIEIGTIFIDEGFGALDAQSLQHAIKVLYQLSDGNRLVGIISHVEELKSCIHKTITITKDKLGSKLNCNF